MLLEKFIWLTFLCHLCSSYRVLLLFPVPGRSHAILGEGYVKHLLDAGHEVTYITPIVMKKSHPKLRQIDVSSNSDLMPVDRLFDIITITNSEFDFKDIRFLLYVTTNFANGTILHPGVQRLIHDTNEHFDVVIAEWLYSELYSGLSTVFNCPLIWSSSMEPHSSILDLIDDVLNPAYNPSHLSDLLPPFNFWGRVHELWSLINEKVFKWRLRHRENRIFINAFKEAVEKRGQVLPPFNEVKYNASLMFGNSNVVAGNVIRLPQNYIPIGGYHISENVDPLPSDIQSILDAAQNGLIYFSMGSMLKSSRFPMEMKRGLLDIFSKLNQTVLWKFEEALPDLPKNVHIVSWAPQPGILAHPNCKLFITHGGLLSIHETIHFGVPIIGIPMFGDQHLNINRAVEKAFGKRVDLNSDIAVNMEAAITEILNDDRYQKRVKEYSFIYHDRLTPPGKVLSHWVSHVIRTNGAHYLRSPAFLVPWYQKMYIDLQVVLLILLYLLLWVLTKVLNKLMMLGRRLITIKQKILYLFFSFLTIYIHIHNIYIKPT